MKIFYLIFLCSCISFSQNVAIDKYKNDYSIEIKKNGILILTENNNPSVKKIINSDGKVVFSCKDNFQTGFLSGLNCGKFFTSKIVGRGNDGGGYTIFEHFDVKIHDVNKPNSSIPLNLNLSNLSSSQPFEFYTYFDSNKKIGLINSCGEVVIKAKYNRFANFNKSGFAVVYSDFDYDVIDTLGQTLLEKPFLHGLKEVPVYYDFDLDNINDNRIVSSIDGKQFGIFDFKQRKQLIANKYDKIVILGQNYFEHSWGNNELAYLAKKNDIVELIDYSSFKSLLPISVGAVGIRSASKLNDKPLIIYYENNPRDKYSSFENIYYDGKTLFDSKLKIKKILIYEYNYFALQLDNGDSMIYDFKRGKFIITIKAAPASIYSTDQILGDKENKMQNRISPSGKYINVIIPCVGDGCYGESSSHSSLFDLNGNAKTSFLQGAKYSIIQIDKQQEKLMYLVYHRTNSLALVYTLFDSKGKILLDNFNIRTSQKDFDYVVHNNLLVLNEDMGDFVYGKTAFDVDGNMIGERYKYSLKPLRNQPENKNPDNSKIDTPNKNRFLKSN